MTAELATLGGGCFWCLEAVFQRVRGVTAVASGYAGGETSNPSYEAVCSGSTGHAEVVQLAFDPDVITFRELLEIFFAIHDPTTLNRQGNDVGTQYRSVIFSHSEEQSQTAHTTIREFDDAKIWDGPIVTEVVPQQNFYAADESHQHYYRRNQTQSYCQVVISPKVAKLRQLFADKLVD